MSNFRKAMFITVVSYSVSGRLIGALSKEALVPEETLKKLNPLIGRKFPDEPSFQGALERVIGKEGVESYGASILEKARIDTMKKASVIGDIFGKAEDIDEADCVIFDMSSPDPLWPKKLMSSRLKLFPTLIFVAFEEEEEPMCSGFFQACYEGGLNVCKTPEDLRRLVTFLEKGGMLDERKAALEVLKIKIDRTAMNMILSFMRQIQFGLQ